MLDEEHRHVYTRCHVLNCSQLLTQQLLHVTWLLLMYVNIAWHEHHSYHRGA